MARSKKNSSDSISTTQAKKRAADKAATETGERKRVAPEVRPSAERVAVESYKQQVKQVPIEKDKNRGQAQVEEESNKMKSKSQSEEKLSKTKVRKLRAVSSSPPPGDIEEQIRQRAYQIYLENPSASDPVANWLKAEAEIKAKYGAVVNQ
ncbi:MAG: DUF2934 domain-containing protein [Deltaproteobacteria bacterium]|nr:DUF2934 domain-containing protein [Deltaproteobacteria bacterium]